VKSEAAGVEAYIAAAPEARRGALELLHGLCRTELEGFEEAMRYGMPSYSRDCAVEIAFANQQRYVSLYVLRQAALQAVSDRLGHLSVGKGAVRFRPSDAIDPELVRLLLRATVADKGPIC
jgi:uncharacterized protein YdhG (YjbR/CyaY superfamily)